MIAVIVGQIQVVTYSADAEYAVGVDNVLPAQSQQIARLTATVADGVLQSSQTIGNHEVGTRGIVDIGVVVVRLHVEHLVQVNDVEFVVAAKAKVHFLLHLFTLFSCVRR